MIVEKPRGWPQRKRWGREKYYVTRVFSGLIGLNDWDRLPGL